MNNLLIKKKWLKFIPSGTCFVKKENIGLFSKGKHINRELINWNKLWFYLQYQFIALKNSINLKNSILFITDLLNYQFFVKTIALKTKNFFAVGPWQGGRLTKLKWYKFLPVFVINFGMEYSKNFLTEISLIGIPFLNFNNNLNFQKVFSTAFNIPFLNMEVSNMRNLCYLFAFLIKNYLTFFFYAFQIIKENLNSFYIDKIKSISNKLSYFKKCIKYFQFSNFFYIKNFFLLKTINNTEKLYFLFTKTLKMFLTFKKLYIPIFYKFFQKKHKKYFLQKNICVFSIKKQKKQFQLNFLNQTLYNKKINKWVATFFTF